MDGTASQTQTHVCGKRTRECIRGAHGHQSGRGDGANREGMGLDILSLASEIVSCDMLARRIGRPA